jgi:hypothetical protein
MSQFKNKIPGLVLCLVMGIGVVAVLYIYSQKANHRNNPFTRLFPPQFLGLSKQIELKFNSFYLSGCTKNNIYLGNKTAAAFLLITNYALTDSGHKLLSTGSDIKMSVPDIKLIIDSPDIYILEGVSPNVLHGTLNNPVMADLFYQGPHFDAVSLISKSSLAIRTYDESSKEYMLGKSNFVIGRSVRYPEILMKRGDGLFSLDGLLLKDSFTGQLVYVYFYRNEFISMDSNMHVLLRGKTIDSIHTPQLKVTSIVSEGTITLSSPPLFVNKAACADSGFLFVNSGLMAKNEDEEDFSKNSVIDIYSLKNGEYVYSFYVPDEQHGKLKSFAVSNHHLIGLYDHTLITFKMNF